MCRKLLRSSLASLIVLAFALSLLPGIYANAGQSTQSPRRGKNGTPSNGNSSQPASNNSQSSSSTPDDRSVKQDSSATDADQDDAGKPTVDSGKSKSDVPSFSRGAESPAPSSQPQTSVRKAAPPPFDRPPMSSGGAVSSLPTSSSSSPSSNSTYRNTQSYPSANSRTGVTVSPVPSSSSRGPAQTSDAPPYSTSRSSGPPVLRRPSPADSRTSQQTSSDNGGNNSGYSSDPSSSSSRGRGAPPVLHRPGDETSDNQSSGSQRQPDYKNNPPPANQQSSDGQDDVVKLQSTLINIPLMVSDRSGRYIPQLRKEDFVLYEDGVQQEIASFGSEEVPFNVALLLDVSPSVEGNADSIQEAALAFVRQLRPQDRVMVVSFDRQVHYLSDFTNDRRQLESAIRNARIGSGTSVYDAVYDVVSRRLRNVEGRKAMILFSDGEDTTSNRVSYDDAINVVTESDVLVYGLRYPGAEGGGGGGGGWGRHRNNWPRSPVPNLPIPWPFPRPHWPFTLTPNGSGSVLNATGGDPQWRRHGGLGRLGGGDFMKDITEAGGGPVYDAEQVGDMSRLAERIADELRHVYVLSYYPKNPISNGGYRAIRIKVKNRDDIAVRHRRGYNAGDMNSPSHTE